MAKQSLINGFSDLTGISKRSLALFLDTQQSLLSMVESGQRNLPAHTLPVLAGLYKHAATVTNIVAAKPNPEDKAAAKEQAVWSITQCHPLQKKLSAMQEKYRQAAAAIVVLDKYQQENSPLPKKKQRWIDEQRYQAEKKLKANGWMHQQQLSVSIAILRHEASLWQQAVS